MISPDDKPGAREWELGPSLTTHRMARPWQAMSIGIHVIERSAYDSLKSQLEIAEKALREIEVGEDSTGKRLDISAEDCPERATTALDEIAEMRLPKPSGDIK